MYCESGSEYWISWILFGLSDIKCAKRVFQTEHIPFLLLTGYTLFAVFEYLVVFSNMAFHLTAVWDFKSREVMVISSSEDKDFWLETQGLRAACTNSQPLDHSSLDSVQEAEWDEGLFHIFSWRRLLSPYEWDCQTNSDKNMHILSLQLAVSSFLPHSWMPSSTYCISHIMEFQPFTVHKKKCRQTVYVARIKWQVLKHALLYFETQTEVGELL